MTIIYRSTFRFATVLTALATKIALGQTADPARPQRRPGLNRPLTAADFIETRGIVPLSVNFGGVVSPTIQQSVTVENQQAVALYNVPTDALGNDSVSDHGGLRIDTADLQLIFWGSSWQNATNPSTSNVTAAVQSMVTGPYLSQLTQYGYRSLHLRPSLTVTNSNPPASFTDGDVANLVWSLISNGTFPDPDDPGGRILYIVLMPSSANYRPANARGAHTDSDFCETHIGPICVDSDTVWTAWVGNGSLDYMSEVLSHELVEMITDPEPNNGEAWLMNRTINGGTEIGDACKNTTDRLDGILVQAYWSQTLKACVIPRGGPSFESGRSQGMYALDGPLGQVRARTEDVFGRNGASQLIHFTFTQQSNWQAQNLTQTAGAGYGFGPGMVAVDGVDQSSQHVFAINSSGELIHYYMIPQFGWAAENLTRYPNIGANFRIADNLNVLNAPNFNAQHVFARNTSNELIHYYWTPFPGWQAENLTRYPNIGQAFQFVSNLHTINGADNFTQHAFAKNASNELIHYYWIPWLGWQAENLTRYSNIGPAFQFVSDLTAINAPGGANVQHVFARNANNELVHYYWSPQPGWQAENITRYSNIGSSFQFDSNLKIINGADNLTQHAFARNSSHELIHYYWIPWLGWQAENLTHYPNIGAAFQFVDNLTLLDDITTNAQHAFARNSSGELIHYFWSPQPGWKAENLTRRLGGPQILDDLTAIIGPDGISEHAFARNANGEVIHYHSGGPQAGWQVENVTQRPGIGAAFQIQ